LQYKHAAIIASARLHGWSIAVFFSTRPALVLITAR
jgi:hypothetical protein